MRHIQVYRVLPFIMFIAVFGLVACGGDSDNTEATELVLPTLALMPDSTADITPDAEDSTPPEATEALQPPDSASVPVLADQTAEVITPLIPSTPSSDSGPPEVSTTSNEPGPAMIDNFAQLAVGTSGIFVGSLVVEENEEDAEPTILLTDTQGVALSVIIPPVFVAGLSGEVVQVQGFVDVSESDENQLVIHASNIALDSEGLTQSGPPNINENPFGEVPEGVETQEAVAGGPPINQIETLEFQLDENLTALEAYDALLAEIEETIGEAIWITLTGNTELGWTIEFYDQDSGMTSTYIVNADGTVQVSSAQSFLPPDTEANPIDRSLIIVDSDDIPEPESNGDGPPIGAPLLILNATAEGRIEWTVQGATITTIDATTAQ